MFCSPSSQHGLLEIVGPIQQTDLNAITISSSPLVLSFATRTTPPTRVPPYIVEASPADNTCSYKGQKYPLLDIQVTTVTHKGFQLPGMTEEAWGELIVTFGTPGALGILLVFPLYTSTAPARAEYLAAALHGADPSHPDSVNPPSLATLFAGDETQTALAYTACYETIADGVATTQSLYVSVFPHGVRMLPADTENLKTIQGAYRVPVSLRGPDPTLRTYQLTQQGDKRVGTTSTLGELPVSSLSSCSAEFKKTLEFCTVAPMLGEGRRIQKVAVDPSKSSNYKCVPMEQLRDANGQFIKLGSKTLKTVLEEQQKAQTAAEIATVSGADKTIELVLEIVGTAGVLAIIGAGCYVWWKATEE